MSPLRATAACTSPEFPAATANAMADLAIVTAVSGSGWESQLVSTIDRAPGGLYVARRCVDVPDLLATAAAGHGRVVLVSADFRRLDRDAVSQLRGSGVAVVGVVMPESAADVTGRMRKLGIDIVVRADATPEQLSVALEQAVAHVDDEEQTADALGSADEYPSVHTKSDGRVITVWGPYGSPGRTTLAVNVANELAGLGYDTLLIDADTFGGSIAQMLGLLDEAPGLAGAARAANNGHLDAIALAKYERTVLPSFRVLTGLVRPARWRELRPSALEGVFDVARQTAEYIVIDAGFSLDLDDASVDAVPQHRNAVTLAALEHADQVVAVGSGDPIGLTRLTQGLSELREFLPSTPIDVVINRVRDGAGRGTGRQIKAALWRYANVEPTLFVPDDPRALDTALAQGMSLAEVAGTSSARRAFRELALRLAGVPSDEKPPGNSRTRRPLDTWRSLGRVVERR